MFVSFMFRLCKLGQYNFFFFFVNNLFYKLIVCMPLCDFNLAFFCWLGSFHFLTITALGYFFSNGVFVLFQHLNKKNQGFEEHVMTATSSL